MPNVSIFKNQSFLRAHEGVIPTRDNDIDFFFKNQSFLRAHEGVIPTRDNDIDFFTQHWAVTLKFGRHRHSKFSLTLDTQLSWPRKGRVFQIHFRRVFQIHFQLFTTYFFDFGKLSV